MDVLCVLHDSDEYGVCRWPLADLARSAGVPLKLLKELSSKDVLKGGDKGTAAYIYTPRSGRTDGKPVTLIEQTTESCWYSSRLVRDEYIRKVRGSSTRFESPDEDTKAGEKHPPNPSPKGGLGEGLGDGSTFTSTSTSTVNKEPNGSVASKLPTCQTQDLIDLYHEVLPELPAVRLLSDQRRKAISNFWKWVLTSKRSDGEPRATNADEAKAWCREYFKRARNNDFLMGRTAQRAEHANWTCDFDFLLTEKGKKHVIEKTEEVTA